jgi:very-short-patch-repair endonuclease
MLKNILKNNGINYKHNHPINKRDLGLNDACNYFLDFYIEDKKIDLEIDGNQHKFRKEHDKKRDEILTKNGFIVYRIKWKNINTENKK